MTQSARLCLFCGEKLPEDLLLPLAEVQREEQRSLDAVKRVLAAYEARETEIIERSKHITHAGLLFEDQVTETFFPAVDAGSCALHEFRRTLKLPDDDFDARAHKRALDGRIRKLVSNLAARFGRLNCKTGTDQAGHLTASLKDKALLVLIETQFGKNAILTAGNPQPFRPYGIRAEARVLSLSKADRAAQRLRIVCMAAGILGMAALFVWLAFTISNALQLEMFHHLWLHEPGVTLALLFGAWVGAKAGWALSAWLEKRTVKRAEAEGALPRMESLWNALTEEIEDITREYDVV